MENFDAVGAWRTKDLGTPIEPLGKTVRWHRGQRGNRSAKRAVGPVGHVRPLAYGKAPGVCLRPRSKSFRYAGRCAPLIVRLQKTTFSCRLSCKKLSRAFLSRCGALKRPYRYQATQRRQRITTDSKPTQILDISNSGEERTCLSPRNIFQDVQCCAASGAGLALPFLDAMVPAQTPLNKTAAVPKPRLCTASKWCTVRPEVPWMASKSIIGRRSKTAAISSSRPHWISRAFREYMTIVSNTDLNGARSWTANEEGADHTRSSAVFLTGAHPKMTEGSDIYVRNIHRPTLRPTLRPGHAFAVTAALH